MSKEGSTSLRKEGYRREVVKMNILREIMTIIAIFVILWGTNYIHKYSLDNLLWWIGIFILTIGLAIFKYAVTKMENEKGGR